MASSAKCRNQTRLPEGFRREVWVSSPQSLGAGWSIGHVQVAQNNPYVGSHARLKYLHVRWGPILRNSLVFASPAQGRWIRAWRMKASQLATQFCCSCQDCMMAWDQPLCCRIVKPVSPKKTRVTLHDGRQRHLEASDATESGFSKAYRCDSKRGNQVVAIHSTKYELHVRMPCWQNMGVH